MIACWTVKGGSGVSVVSALAARALAGNETSVLADIAGDQPVLWAMRERPTPGLKQWAEAAAHAPLDALAKLAVPADAGVALVGSGVVGSAEVDGPTAGVAAAKLAQSCAVDVVDAGCITPLSRLGAAVVSMATESWLVIRPCYLALARAVATPLVPTKVLVVDEPGRSLDHRDVAAVLGVEVAAVIKWDPALARAADSGNINRYKGRSLSVVSALTEECASSIPQLASLQGSPASAHFSGDAA